MIVTQSERPSWKNRAFAFYERNEAKLSLLFFFGGFLFDVVMLPGIEDHLAYVQQAAYLLFVGGILFYDFQWGQDSTLEFGPNWLRRAWAYRGLAEHFFLGTLFNIYSLFFLQSSSIFSSVIFVLLLIGVVIGNELESVRKSGVDTKVVLFAICLFCFFIVFVPLTLGFVGRLPFLLSLLCTLFFLALFHWMLSGRVSALVLRRRLLVPSGAVLLVFSGLYFLGWIPPVPLSAVKMGIYHRVEKRNGEYVLFSEKPGWEFWRRGDQSFMAQPGDKLFFFVSLFSPARFDDQVVLHWYWKNPKVGWESTDRIPMRVTGGREGGYRGTTSKSNFTEGDWKVAVETTDLREVARLYFNVTKVPADPARVLSEEVY
jgi:hypothetical protein